jgi:dienelactone hydrolase
MQAVAEAGTAAPTAGSGTSSGEPSGGNESACLDGITKYDEQGPFMFMSNTMGAVKILVPMVPAGCKVPILHLANGTGASCTNYQPILERFASHGFLTTCYENPNTGAGTQGVMAFETAMKAYPDLFVKKLGSTGHSQGGQSSFMVLVLSEQKWGMTDFKYAGLAMEPASGFGSQPSGGSWQSWYGKIKSPMFAFSGTADMLVPQAWVQQGYDALSDDIEAYHWSAVGATHIPTPDEHTMQIGVAWWRWKLLGDKAACEFFKKLPDGDQWNKVREQNVPPC